MREWTADEVYAELSHRTRIVDGKPVLTLADIEAVLFDARFPSSLESLAKLLLDRINAIKA